LSETFLILRKIQHIIIITYTGLHVKHLSFLSDFNETEIFHLQVHAQVMAAGIMYSDYGNTENVAYSCTIAYSKWKMHRIPLTKEHFHGEIPHTICFVEQQSFQSYFVSVFLMEYESWKR